METSKTLEDGKRLNDLLDDSLNCDNCDQGYVDIARYMQNQNMGLVLLVEKLGPALTDKNPERRRKGTQVLAEVLQHLPQNFIQSKELHFINNFFCDRLKDNIAVIPPALQGIHALVQMQNLPKDAPAMIATTVFLHVQCQTLKQGERSIIYKIFKTLLQRFTKELKLLGPDFLYGIITVIDGERDPRNLMLLFGMLPHFLRTFSLGHLAEDMFEVMACYFPIDFYSSPQDPNAITRDALSAALVPCLTAVPEFCEFCIPLLLEKLDSQLRIAKLDSLKMLQECCKTFTVQGMEKFLYDLFGSLHKEVIPGTDKEVCKEALAAITQLIRMISNVTPDENEVNLVGTMLETIIKDACQSLHDVQFSSFIPAAHMLLAVAQASPIACQSVIKKVVPFLSSQYLGRGPSVEGKVVLLQTISTFLAVFSEQVIPTDCSELTPLWEEITNLYINAAQEKEPEIRKEGIHGFLILVKSIHPETRPNIYDHLSRIVKLDESVHVRKEAITCLKEFSKLYPNEVKESVIFSKLHYNQDSGDAFDTLLQSRCMDALCEIASVEPFTSCIVPQIFSFITSAPNLDKCSIGIKSLRKLVELPDAGPNMHRYLHEQCGAVSCLLSWWLCGICDDEHEEIFHNEALLTDSAKILSTILKTQSKTTQSDIVMEFIPRFLGQSKSPHGETFIPLSASSPWQHTQSIVLLEALLSPVQQGVDIPQFSQLVMRLVSVSIHTQHDLTSLSAARLVACLINKAQDSATLDSLLSEIQESLTAIIHPPSTDAPIIDAKNAVNIFSWITKALIMRSHKDVNYWISKLVDMLSHETVGSVAADGFKLIMANEEEYMTTSNFCNIRFLYRQRFFETAPKLVECYQNANDNVKSYYLVALAFLLQGAPRAAVNMRLLELVPLIIESLNQKDVLLLMTSLETLKELLESKQPILEEHINAFLPRFLHLAKFKDSMKVRITALQCVLQVCNYPTHVIIPLKKQVIHELESCLDDPKRLVRRQAVTTRSRWFLIGAPGEPQNS